MLSKASEYAFRALYFIATSSKRGERVSLAQIATAVNSPEAFTAKILQLLVRKGILNSVKGVQGGYELDLERMKSMKLVDVLLAIEGKDFTNRCILGLEECSSVHPCALHAHVQVVKGHLHRIFNETTLFDLIDRPVEQIMAATLN